MDLAAYLGTVVAVCGLAVGAMYMIVSLLGKHFDDINNRFDDVSRRLDGMDHRLDRLETQNDSILGAVADLGQRVTRLEARGAAS